MIQDLRLAGFVSTAVSLDEWCEFCQTRIAMVTSADGVLACEDCADQVLKALAKYEADAEFLATHRPAVNPAAAKRKAKARAKRKRTKR